jgi:hypothetical protein
LAKTYDDRFLPKLRFETGTSPDPDVCCMFWTIPAKVFEFFLFDMVCLLSIWKEECIDTAWG